MCGSSHILMSTTIREGQTSEMEYSYYRFLLRFITELYYGYHWLLNEFVDSVTKVTKIDP